MTNKKTLIKLSILITVFIVISLSGCFSHWQGDAAQIVISIGGAERKVYDPQDTTTHEKLEHEVIFTNGTKKLTFNKSGTTFETTVAPGEWKITVNSWIDGEIYATGSTPEDITLKPGLNNVTIDMHQVFWWWTYNSSMELGEYISKTTVTINRISDNSGYVVNVSSKSGELNDQWYYWASNFGRSYIATEGKTYKVTWKWQAVNEPFKNVTIRYARENQKDGVGDNFYTLGNENLTIPTYEEPQSYEFTMPGNCIPNITFIVGGDTGSFKIWDLKVEEVKIPSSTKKITFYHSRGDVGSNGEPYDNWLGIYDIQSSIRGDKINAGDVFTFNYTFTSDVTINKDDWAMSVVLVDNSETAEPQYWKELSDSYPMHHIRAKEEVSGTITLTADETASSSSAGANRLAFIIYPAEAVARHPTLTFTKFEFKKVQVAQGDTLADKLNWLKRNAANGGNYIITVNNDTDLAPQDLSYSGKKVSIILKGEEKERTVSLSSNGEMFTIKSGITLILDNNITLQGLSTNKDSLVKIENGGILIMNSGSKITGNDITAASTGGAGGVYINSFGTFYMYGGDINFNNGWSGGGVYVNGTFEMEGGNISSNTAKYGGGGVEVGDRGGEEGDGGNFKLKGGNISGNTAQWAGGGVFVNGIFTMSNGNIFNNTASEGGGVFVQSNKTFTMNGGEITGNEAAWGGGVCVHDYGIFTMSGTAKIKDNTAIENGGGVKISAGTFIMNGGEITNNTAKWGGGIEVWDGIINKLASGGRIYENNIVGDANGYVSNSIHANNASGFRKNRESAVESNEEIYYNGKTNEARGWDDQQGSSKLPVIITVTITENEPDPLEKQIVWISVNEQKVFEVSQDYIDIKWYLNGVRVSSYYTYTFVQSTPGIYEVSVVVTDTNNVKSSGSCRVMVR